MTSKSLTEPQDEDRVNVDVNSIDNYYTNFGMHVNGVPASLVFNMDEAGQDEYVFHEGYC